MKMSYEKKIATLVVLLAIVFAALGYLYTGLEEKPQKTYDITTSNNSEQVYAELTKEVKKSDTRNVVSDRFSEVETDDGYIIVASSDGSKYVVKSGSVLIDDKVIRVSEESSSLVVLENRDK